MLPQGRAPLLNQGGENARVVAYGAVEIILAARQRYYASAWLEIGTHPLTSQRFNFRNYLPGR